VTLTACIVLLASVPGIGDAHRALVAHAAHLADAKVGDWVTYRFASAERGAQYLRLAIVEAATDRLGRDAFWIEMEIGEHPSMEAPIAQIRLLAAKDFGLRREGVTRVIAAIGMELPAEIPPERLLATPRRATAPPPGGEEQVRAGAERLLATGAGTLSAVPVEVVHGRTVLERLWICRRVPLLHLARMELLPIGHSAEVWDYGADAHSTMALPTPNGLNIRRQRAEESP
jgi:hypothetical protein